MLVADTATRHAAESAYARLPDAARAIRAEADAALTAGPFSVMDKRQIPPSGDRHDYMSLGTYWWPDPAHPGGPYIRRDGHVNPEIERFDRPRLSEMADAVVRLSAAWHLGRDAAHGGRAALLLRTWFLDPATRMNPHLRYGQSIPGVCDGRCIGIIDSECLARIADAEALLDGAPGWSAAERHALHAWMSAYLDWLLHDPLGRAESAERNNHGTCYDVQVVALALHLGRREEARGILAAVPERRTIVQIEADGSQPLELARTRSWTYSLKNLCALLNLASWGRAMGIPVWEASGADGRSIARAVDFMARTTLGGQPWMQPQLGGVEPSELLPALVRAAQLDPSRRQALDAAGIDSDLVCLRTFAGMPLGAVGAIGGRRGFN